MANGSELSPRRQATAAIAAFTATGQLPQLRDALADGLDTGLTVTEINEILVQMYAYAGFPRALNGLGAFMALLQERRDSGIDDPAGEPPTPLPAGTDMLALGTENQTRLSGRPVTGPLFDFAPAIDEFLKAHLFGDIFARDTLDWQSREVATVAALATLDGVESQLRSHLGIALNAGLSPADLHGLVATLRSRVGQAASDRAGDLLDQVLAGSDD
ncbi:carboxymuconolactone decarboxylase family protein [Micromonospora sp. WMMD980]|uniref:carboxymuconolactone decarboxylase family protein n=1 Tax=Micromonospora sp. WMMD980 TaxID=3016088 RepID=UPI0024160CC7|nr:carboxymuconolactone decarboxylase family protein [Micromonospora sp. WMMD980]MDG4800108.1 carboxymuconolactone decarboxylase family protein [Micromonospora sp. WMMD980]